MSRRGLAVLLPLLALALPALADPGVPRGWFLTATVPAKDFEIGTAPAPGIAGKQAAYIRALPTAPRNGFIGLNQCVAATDYRGKRMRFSANMRSIDASSEQLFMRVDAARSSDGKSRSLRFYNNVGDAISGTIGWKRYDIVLDVPEESGDVCYGFLLDGGKGEIWANDVRVEIVPDSVPISQLAPLKAPFNLGFEK